VLPCSWSSACATWGFQVYIWCGFGWECSDMDVRCVLTHSFGSIRTGKSRRDVLVVFGTERARKTARLILDYREPSGAIDRPSARCGGFLASTFAALPAFQMVR
jgi:hypothetical protein